MILCKPKIQNTHLTSSTKEEKVILSQISVNNIDKEAETVATKKEKATILASHHLFEKALSLISIKENKDDEDLENFLQF